MGTIIPKEVNPCAPSIALLLEMHYKQTIVSAEETSKNPSRPSLVPIAQKRVARIGSHSTNPSARFWRPTKPRPGI